MSKRRWAMALATGILLGAATSWGAADDKGRGPEAPGEAVAEKGDSPKAPTVKRVRGEVVSADPEARLLTVETRTKTVEIVYTPKTAFFFQAPGRLEDIADGQLAVCYGKVDRRRRRVEGTTIVGLINPHDHRVERTNVLGRIEREGARLRLVAGKERFDIEFSGRPRVLNRRPANPEEVTAGARIEAPILLEEGVRRALSVQVVSLRPPAPGEGEDGGPTASRR